MSYIIVEKSTQKAICELFEESTVKAINAEKYQAIPALEYLQNFNKQLKALTEEIKQYTKELKNV